MTRDHLLRVRLSALAGSAVHRITAKAHEVRQNFSENKDRSIALLRKAIGTLEDEIADAEPLVVAAKRSTATPIIEAAQESKATPNGEVRMLQSRRWGGIAFEAAWHRVARWWRGRNS